MSDPKNKENFVVEITPEVYHELMAMYAHAENDNPIADLHYSPYWDWDAHIARVKAKK